MRRIILCDRPYCYGQRHFPVDMPRLEAEKILKCEGWAVLDQHDYMLCPKCMKQQEIFPTPPRGETLRKRGG
jgi:hypothetical protein